MIENILNKIHEEQDGLMDADGNFVSAENEEKYHTLCDLEAKIYSLAKKSVNEELEEAAMNYTVEIKGFPGIMNKTDKKVFNAFKAGWQAGQEQMMKDAVEAEVEWYDGLLLNYTQEAQDIALEKIDAKVGDKIKLIIVKED